MKTILIIDDDDCDQFLCQRVIDRAGFDCELLQAYDGDEALELLKTAKKFPDLILLDINMPRMNGHEFLEAYSQFAPGEVPVVVMLTSSDQSYDRDNALSYSIVKEYLLKPLRKENLPHLEKLVKTVKALCETEQPTTVN